MSACAPTSAGDFAAHAAELFEIGERTAPIADHAAAAFDQVLRDRHADLADADKADGFRGYRRHHITSTD